MLQSTCVTCNGFLPPQNAGSSPVNDPCLFKGATVTVSSSNIFTTCTNSSTAVQVFGHQLTPPPSLSSAQSYTFTGTGNSYECQETVKAALFCHMSNCSIFDLPPVAGRFVVSLQNTLSFNQTCSNPVDMHRDGPPVSSYL